VVAPLALVQGLLPLLSAAGGAVINITSDAAVEPYERWGGYGSSKAALEQLSHVLAAEEPLLRVWWFDPGDMRTRMHQEAFPGEDISDRPLPATVVPAIRRLLHDRPPSGRIRAADVHAAQPAGGPGR
jgi:NAD(P)-dependent dehydrogenase (short-subunit alcohol dehydrogenase family)